jgi:N utilization substance protein B
MTYDNTDLFPLSKLKKVKGSRHLAREKALQILTASEVSGTEWEVIFQHVFYRNFNFGDEEEKPTKLLNPEEIVEIEADIPIIWKQDEKDFAVQLIESAFVNREFINTLIESHASNWKIDRIALIDKILMQIAITEIMKFPEIPTKVSINESIELSKKYSTDKSGTFINGLLDAVLEELKKKGLVNKTGRGLVD